MVKCIVFDLDNTIWDGTLDANDNVKLNEDIVDYIKKSFERGIVLAIASKNNYEQAYKKLEEFGIEKYFYKCYILWDDKYKAILDLAKLLNISEKDIMFIDDSDIELAEALYYIPDLQILNTANIEILNDNLEDITKLTEEAKNRNKIYKILEERNLLQAKMSKEEFLKYCNIKVEIKEAVKKNIPRIIELLQRTNQMNLNNKILSNEKVEEMILDSNYKVYIVKMNDIFADYGIVGTCILKFDITNIEIKYFAISCKVEGRNIGSEVLRFIKDMTCDINKDILAEFIFNSKNEKLKALFVLNGFTLNENNIYIYNYKNKIVDNINNSTKIYNLHEKDRIKKILFEISKKNYEDNETISEDFDSIMFVTLIVALEKEFKIEIDLSEISINNFKTVNSICNFLRERCYIGI